MKYRKLMIIMFTTQVLLGCAMGDKTNEENKNQSPIKSNAQPIQTTHNDSIKPEVLILPNNEKQGIQRAKVPFSAKLSSMPLHIQLPPQNINLKYKDNYLPSDSNGIFQTKITPLSTFSVDVDTGSYANIRSQISMGQMPHKDAIREEAFINYFNYHYEKPKEKTRPFLTTTEIAPSVWSNQRHILRIGLQGFDLPASQRKPSNLVFLVDVSGSMHQPNKLPLLISSLSMLTKQLSKHDTVSIVTYAGHARVVLKPTSGEQKNTILSALKSLKAGGGTHGESGINLAYQQAKKGFKKGGINRLILATDGDFNVGTSSLDALKNIVAMQRKTGVSLSTLGFGRGNYNDAMMEQLANIGDGNHAYIDTLHEAKKVLSRQMSGTLQSIAKDVKIQIEFNPSTVKEYRLIGYQNRLLKKEDFNNDNIDAGEIGAGHTVTALYELTLTGNKGQIDELRYQENPKLKNASELAQVKIRYKLPDENKSLLETHLIKKEDIIKRLKDASSDFKFASAVAAFAQKLKHNNYVNSMSYNDIAILAKKNKGDDPFNYRAEFVTLVELASTL